MTEFDGSIEPIPSQRTHAGARLGWRLIADGHFADAHAAFRQAVTLGDVSADTLDALDDLTPAAERPALYAELLSPAGPDWPPLSRALLALRRFDAAQAVDAPPASLASAAADALEAAAGCGDPIVWTSLAQAQRREHIFAALTRRDALLAGLEHLACAPAGADIRPAAVAFAERIGRAAVGDPELRRAAESTLYALARESDPDVASAARTAARQIERLRKAESRAIPTRADAPERESAISLNGRRLVVALVGGDDRLRAAIVAALVERGVTDIREIPPAWEGRRGGGIEPFLHGVDLVLLLIRQLDHSTANQAETIARSHDIAVRRVPTASVAAAVAAVAAWTRSRQG